MKSILEFEIEYLINQIKNCKNLNRIKNFKEKIEIRVKTLGLKIEDFLNNA